MNKDQQLLLLKSIDEILWNDWDPIGMNGALKTKDEYQGYIAGIFSLLLSNQSNEIIAQLLFSIETEQMGLIGNTEHCIQIVAKLRDAKNSILSK